MTQLVAARIERDVLRVAGPDAEAYLQGQLSQDVAGLAAGGSAWSFLLQPQGKVDAWLRVSRTGPEEFVVDLDPGGAEPATARLERFKLRSRFDIEALDWSAVAVRGPGAGGIDPGGAEVVAPAGWPGIDGVDLLGPGPAAPDGAEEIGPGRFEQLRIAHGVPRMGAELTEATIPAEAGPWVIDASVDFTKGCFTGQELVARIDSRGGNVPRLVRGLVTGHDARLAVGEAVTLDGAEVGTVTSAAPGVALAKVKRGIEPPAEVTVASVPARIGEIPLPLPN